MLNLDHNKKYLLACSYGPDSMALFSMLLNEHYSFEVAHVNYHLRKESNLEEEKLTEFCNKNGIKIHVKNVEENITKNIEEEARNIRYTFFKQVMKNSKLSCLLVAHNQDDLIETYLLQKKRNNHVKYYGIADISSNFDMIIIRPLLKQSKKELQLYCQENKVPFMIDKSNFDDKFERNKIRHNIVSKMSNEERVKIITEINEKNNEKLILQESLNNIDIHNVEDLLTLDIEALQLAIVMLMENKCYHPISVRFITEIKKKLQSNKPNIKIHITGNFYFIKQYSRLDFVEINSPISYSYKYASPTYDNNEYFYMDFRVDSNNRNVKLDDYPITIRNSHKNDIHIINGYKVSVRRLFIDWKMPITLRDKWPVILNKNNEVIYIPRYNKDFVPDSNCNFYIK